MQGRVALYPRGGRQESNMNRSDRVGVIGGGLAGLASACVLAARGYRVVLFDKNPWLGGKAAVLHGETSLGTFRFDMGPTILTLPEVLRRIFGEAGLNLDDRLDLVRLDPQWRCFFDGGGMLDLHEHTDTMTQALTRFAGSTEAGRYRDFIAYSRRLHEISERFFFWKPIGGLGDMVDHRNTFNLATAGDVLAMRMGRSVAGTIRSYVRDERVAQMLDHFTQYVGSSPYGSPAILCGIAHMQTDRGVWYPMGGTRAVPEALLQLAGELGVELRPDEAVTRIETAGGQVAALHTERGERVEVAAAVSNMDAVRTMRELIEAGPDDGMARPGDREPACSGVVLYLGLSRRYDHVAHHDFVFSRNPHEEFDAIYRRGEPAPDPTCYLACPSHTEPQVAPPGGEALYVLVHTPYLRPHHDWRRDGDLFRSYRRTILDKLKRTAGMADIEDRIVFERALTPQDIHERYRVLNGAIYGLASHGKFLGAFKPSNRCRSVRGLYLAGGAAHPGPGMPMVLMSGWIAADALDRDGVAPRGVAAATATARDAEPVLV
jgi:diapolycopene oxygenase